MSASRAYNEAGPQALSDLDLQAWQMNTGRRLELWELTAIRRLDMALRRSFARSMARSFGKRPQDDAEG